MDRSPLRKNVVLQNDSDFHILMRNSEGKDVMVIPPKVRRESYVNEGYSFYVITNVDNRHSSLISIGELTLLRLAADVAGFSHVGPLTNAVFDYSSKEKAIIHLGAPLQYRDDQIYSQKTTLRSYTGGVPWVDIVNMTDISLTLHDGLESSDTFEIPPGGVYRYKGRSHWGVNYGTYISNPQGYFAPAQILSPITHLMYGVF